MPALLSTQESIAFFMEQKMQEVAQWAASSILEHIPFFRNHRCLAAFAKKNAGKCCKAFLRENEKVNKDKKDGCFRPFLNLTFPRTYNDNRTLVRGILCKNT